MMTEEPWVSQLNVFLGFTTQVVGVNTDPLDGILHVVLRLGMRLDLDFVPLSHAI